MKSLTTSNRSLFGTDGIRGRANQHPITPSLMLKLGQAIGLHFKKNYHDPKILIGKDTRKSGYMLEQALSAGICSIGVDSYFLGPLPTPGIAYLTRGMRANAGIVLSASHNPYYDNGIKIFSGNGYKLPDSVEQELEELISNDNRYIDLPTGKALGESKRVDDAVGQYSVFLKEQFPKHLSLEGVRIVLDTANGSAYKVAPKVFTELGAEVFSINNEPNGSNINNQCGALHPKQLMEKVSLYKADIGIALDGDADRLVVVDNKGELLDGDEILSICGIYLLEKNRLPNKTIVSTIMSNLALDLTMEKHGVKVLRTQVGDRYVVEKMCEGNHLLGGEQSGHLIFRNSSTTGDGILAALCLLEVFLEKGDSIYNLKKCINKLPQTLKSINIPSKVPLQKIPELNKKIELIGNKLGKEGRVLFRYSGTEDKARIMVEGTDNQEIDNYVHELAEFAEKSIIKYCNKNLLTSKRATL